MTKEQKTIKNLTGLLRQRNEKQVQITTYDLFENIETALNMLKEKDKQIDLITEFLGERDLGYYKKEDGGEILGMMRIYNKDDWKQYFEELAGRKSKE